MTDGQMKWLVVTASALIAAAVAYVTCTVFGMRHLTAITSGVAYGFACGFASLAWLAERRQEDDSES